MTEKIGKSHNIDFYCFKHYICSVNMFQFVMKRLLCFALLLQMLLLPLHVSAQVTIKIEKLSKPKELLPVREVKPSGNTLSVNVDADSLVLMYGSHPFFYGMYEAYANHRPFVLSPDMAWMLIAQGFSRHINANPEKYRGRMVDYQGKMSLVVESDKPLDEVEWEKLIPEFAEEIKKNTKGTVAETIIADFSTTTQYEQIASEITLMEATKAYFDFVVISFVCGIPEVTLLGTTEDWQKVYNKALQLRAFDLDWWIDELTPILQQFVEASKGNADVDFWRNMFKWHTLEEYGNPNVIDGWVVKFFPYDKYGKRFDLKTLTRDSKLPNEMAEADVRFVEIYSDGSRKEIVVELYGGFIGLEQDLENFALTPKIGWEVRKKIDEDAENLAKMNEDLNLDGWVRLNVKEVPSVLSKIDTIPGLYLHFIDSVFFPDWMGHKRIGQLSVRGKITHDERDKLLRWYPYSLISINGTSYYNDDAGMLVSSGADVGTALEGIEAVGTLWIFNEERNGIYYTGKAADVTISESTTKKIGKIHLTMKPSRKCLKALKEQFPDTKIEWGEDDD